MRVKAIGRSRIAVGGRVQGVGFRPFVYCLATTLELTGSVQNTASGAVIEIEGELHSLKLFLQQLRSDLPAPASIQSWQQQPLSIRGSKQFEILPSQLADESTDCPAQALSTAAQILPDLSTCSSCLQDIFSPQNRRYHYPFTNCTHCGPRFSIITALPYDRDRTTMAAFEMCAVCQEEYNNPQQRRFHAQPNACGRCGPTLSFYQSFCQIEQRDHEQSLAGDLLSGQLSEDQLLEKAIAILTQGKILALKGLGGFQLLVNACDRAAIATLRQRKARPDKPLALMCSNLDMVRRYCEVSESAAAILSSPQGPIVLLPKRSPARPYPALADNVAPGNFALGVMLPTTPLHHLLLRCCNFPLIATSGNLSGDPICIDEREARHRLGAIADAFLSHNRPIQRPVDDSVVQLVRSQPQILRQARGYAPQVVRSPVCSLDSPKRSTFTEWPCILALGAQLKSAIALSTGNEIILSQHLGALNTPRAIAHLRKTVNDFLSLYKIEPDAIACDHHPDYASTHLAQILAKEREIPLIPVQHHYAHILACAAEHQLHGPALGIAWDGTGYGTDQTAWGGEFLQTTPDGFERVAHLLTYSLPGGDCCAYEPRRSALGLLYRCYGATAFEMTDLAPMRAFKAAERGILRKMLEQEINSPVTSSVGRLFDGVASLLGLSQIATFEGQAALALESAAHQSSEKGAYSFSLGYRQPYIVDWRPMVKAIVQDNRNGVSTAVIAAKFHNTLAEIAVAVAKRSNLSQIVLAGGCFQNTRLSEQTIQRLIAARFTPYWPQQVSPNDGGLAVGQVVAAWRQLSAMSGSVRTGSAAPVLASHSANIRRIQSCV